MISTRKSLTINHFTPPLQGWNRVSYDTDSSVSETLPHKDSTCAGRVLLFVSLAVLAMGLSSCGKEENGSRPGGGFSTEQFETGDTIMDF